MRTQHLLNILTIVAIPFFISGLIISLFIASFFGSYNITTHPMSDLGSFARSPYPFLMNITLIASSIILIFYFFNLFKIVSKAAKKKNIYSYSCYLGFILIGIMIIALFITGVINVDISRDVHDICTIFVFVPLIFGELIIGLIIIALHIFEKYISVLMSFGHLTVSFLYFFVHTPLLEWVFFLILISWGIPLSIKIIQIQTKFDFQ